MTRCRGCASPNTHRVLDLGAVPAADFFPPAHTPVRAAESAHPLAMDLCEDCGLAQLAADDTRPDEPKGVEPQALRDQAAAAVRAVAAAGWLRGATVREFASPHGGSWVPLLTALGYTTTTQPAAVVLDSFGMMHEPDQRAAAAARAAATAPDGVLLLQFHSLAAIVRHGQWNMLRHGHFAYYSLHAVRNLLAGAGLAVAAAWQFDLYGGTVLVAAVHAGAARDGAAAAILAEESALALDDSRVVRAKLQGALDRQVHLLRVWLESEAAAGKRTYAYGAASRAVALFALARLDTRLVAAVADASPGKHGARMPGTDVPIISPAELLAAGPDRVLLTVADLLPELRSRYPALNTRWVTM